MSYSRRQYWESTYHLREASLPCVSAKLLLAVVVINIALAGCANFPGTQIPTADSARTGTTGSTVQSTVAPSELSDSDAKKRPLNA